MRYASENCSSASGKPCSRSHSRIPATSTEDRRSGGVCIAIGEEVLLVHTDGGQERLWNSQTAVDTGECPPLRAPLRAAGGDSGAKMK